jgi:hypothetical protein
MYPVLPRDVKATLQEGRFFWDGVACRSHVRWMTWGETTESDVDSFAAGVIAAFS